MRGKYESLQASTHNTDLTYRVFSIMRRKRECDIEELAEGCDSYSWEEVLQEVVRLSRTGEVRLLYKQGGEYAIRLCSTERC